MIVSELQELLARLPADMTVLIADAGACVHIRVVEKQPRRRANDLFGGPVAAMPDGRYPPYVILRGGIGYPRDVTQPVDLGVDNRAGRWPGQVPWWMAFGDEVGYVLDGRWPAEHRRHR